MKRDWFFWLSLLAVLALSGSARWVLHDKTPARDGNWTLSDPDSLYHARRIERAVLEGGLPASTDEFLNHPEGAAIPWPPYYDALAAVLLAPLVSDGAFGVDRVALEHATGSLPFVFGLLSSLCALLAARQLAGNLAGLCAGCLHALALGSIVYSRIGNGDHHAFLSLLEGLLLLGFCWILRAERLQSRRLGLGLGLGLGALAGLALGSWVAALVLLVLLDGVFAFLLMLQARRPRAGLALFGLGFHLSALLLLAPAVLASPWKQEFPWMVVNLSWFHLVYLALGALVFAPLLLLGENKRRLRIYPWCVALALALLVLVSRLIPGGPLNGIVEGFDWVSRQNSFMSGIEESRPLFGAGHVPGGVFTYLGAFVWLLPLAWAAGLWRLWKQERIELLPWVVALPPLALQAAAQVRFADALLLPAAVFVSWFVVSEIPWKKVRAPRCCAVPAVLLLVGLSQAATCRRLWDVSQGARNDQRRKRASRELCAWIAEREPQSSPAAVLSTWNRGHEIEWAARRPSVATNFGSYVGEVGFLSPAHFFLASDARKAETVLEERDADLVLLTVDLSGALPGWIQAGPESWGGKFYSLDAKGQGKLRRPWFESIGGQLLNGGFARPRRGQGRPDSLDFLRLLHVSPTHLATSPISNWKGSSAYGWVWERVPGARVRVDGEPGSVVRLVIELEYGTGTGKPPQLLRFVQSAELAAPGRVTLRVPYNTTEPNGDGRVLTATWQVGALQGPLRIDERQVREGLEVRARSN